MPTNANPTPLRRLPLPPQRDKPAVEELARRLIAAGLQPFLDKWRLIPGQPWMKGLENALANLAQRAGPDDTAVVFFSGHGARMPDLRGLGDLEGLSDREYILPYDADLSDLPRTAISGDEMTALLRGIRAGRLLVLFDSCHSGGAGEPKAAARAFKAGLSEDTYAGLAQGKGRVVIASCRADEVSWVLPRMRNSLFTHHLLEALGGGTARTLGDGYVRVFRVNYDGSRFYTQHRETGALRIRPGG